MRVARHTGRARSSGRGAATAARAAVGGDGGSAPQAAAVAFRARRPTVGRPPRKSAHALIVRCRRTHRYNSCTDQRRHPRLGTCPTKPVISLSAPGADSPGRPGLAARRSAPFGFRCTGRGIGRTDAALMRERRLSGPHAGHRQADAQRAKLPLLMGLALADRVGPVRAGSPP